MSSRYNETKPDYKDSWKIFQCMDESYLEIAIFFGDNILLEIVRGRRSDWHLFIESLE